MYLSLRCFCAAIVIIGLTGCLHTKPTARNAAIAKAVNQSIFEVDRELEVLAKQVAAHLKIATLYLTSLLDELKLQAKIVKSDMKKCVR